MITNKRGKAFWQKEIVNSLNFEVFRLFSMSVLSFRNSLNRRSRYIVIVIDGHNLSFYLHSRSFLNSFPCDILSNTGFAKLLRAKHVNTSQGRDIFCEPKIRNSNEARDIFYEPDCGKCKMSNVGTDCAVSRIEP